MAESQEKGEAFELRVKALLEQHDFRVERDVLIAGNQIDLVARRSVGPVPEVFVVECKAYTQRVGVNDVNVFIGEVAAAQREDPRTRGVFVSSNGFTKEAKCSAGTAGITCLTIAELEQGLPPVVDFKTAIARYNQHMVDRYGRLTLYSLKANSPLSIELERVYVRLTAVEQVHHQGPAVLWTERGDWITGRFERTKEGEIAFRASSPHIIKGPDQQTESEKIGKKTLPIAVERILSIVDALSENERIIVIGTPGSGKTTLLHWIALTFARNLAQERLGLTERRIPVFIPLRAFGKYVEKHKDCFDPTPACLLDFLETHFDGWKLDLPEGFFARLADEGQCVFLFDGLDEVADPGRRADVARVVEAFVSRYGANRYIVTSRPAGYTGLSHLGADFQRYDIRPFDDEDVETFVTSWYLAVETMVEDNAATRQKANDNAADLLQRIRESNRIRRLVDTPLLLAVVALVHQNRTTLPQRRAELYDECTQMLLGFWDEQKGGEAARELARLGELDRYEKRAILELVALRFHEQEEAQEVEGEELRVWLREEFELVGTLQPDHQAELFLRVIQERAGLLVESEPDTYRFSHLTFQEYLAARAAADREDYIEYTLARRHNPWWREVILLEVGHLSTARSRRYRELATKLVQAIWKAEEREPLEQELERILHRNLLLAGCCLADLGPIGVAEEIRDEVVAELGQILRSTPYSKLREEAAQILAGLGGSDSAKQAAMELACAVAEVADWRIREVAASSLGQLGQTSPDVVATLIAALTDDDHAVRQAAGSSLGQLAHTCPDITPALLQAVADDNPNVRQAAASNLGRLAQANTEVAQALVHALADDHWSVRATAIHNLGQLHQVSSDIVQALIAKFDDDIPEVRNQARTSLVKLAQSNPNVTQALISALSDDRPIVRYEVASSLGQLEQAPVDVAHSLTGILTDNQPGVRQAAALSLIQLKQVSLEALQILTAALEENQPMFPFRYEVISSIGQLSRVPPESFHTLTAALADDNAVIRRAAARSLIQMSQTDPHALKFLITALTDDVLWEVRYEVALSLSQLGRATHDIVQALIGALEDENPAVRQAAAQSLGKLGQASPEMVQALIQAFNDTDNPKVQLVAACSLVNLGETSPEVNQVLTRALTNDDSDIRAAAASSLGQLGQVTHDIVQALTCAIADSDTAVRSAAASSLEQLAAKGRETVLRELLAFFTDPASERIDLFSRPAYDDAFEILWAIAGLGTAEDHRNLPLQSLISSL
jgi:HEAT repeat protein